jgi:hypothetical protein
MVTLKLTSNAVRGLKYVAVHELQTRGTLHLHIGVHEGGD